MPSFDCGRVTDNPEVILRSAGKVAFSVTCSPRVGKLENKKPGEAHSG